MRSFIEEIRPGDAESEATKRHRRSIGAALEKIGIKDVRLVGSFARGSAVAGVSDADYLAVVPRSMAKRGGSGAVLRKIQKALTEEFDQTEIVKDGQALRVEFSDGAVDVVPAVYDGPAKKSGHPVYRIPDGEGGYIRTSPDAHSSYIREANERSGGRLLPLARAVKKWRERTDDKVPLKSLYVEMAVAKAGVADTPGKSYPELLRDTFRHLAQSRLADVEDPAGVTDPIRACRTVRQREAAQAAVDRAADQSGRAVAAEQDGKHQEARRLWSSIFGEEVHE